MPKNAHATAPLSSPISKTAWFEGRRSFIHRIRRRITSLKSPSAWRPVRAARGVGSLLFRKLIEVARAKGYRTLRITTGAQNDAMRALANKFGAHLTFRYGESTGSVDVKEQLRPEPARPAIVTPMDAARAIIHFNRAYWKFLLRLYGWKQTA